MRTARTLSLSLSPEAVAQLEKRGKAKGKTAARVAAEIVLVNLGQMDDERAEVRALEARIAKLEGFLTKQFRQYIDQLVAKGKS